MLSYAVKFTVVWLPPAARDLICRKCCTNVALKQSCLKPSAVIRIAKGLVDFFGKRHQFLAVKYNTLAKGFELNGCEDAAIVDIHSAAAKE